jgi:hypothetical protein
MDVLERKIIFGNNSVEKDVIKDLKVAMPINNSKKNCIFLEKSLMHARVDIYKTS